MAMPFCAIVGFSKAYIFEKVPFRRPFGLSTAARPPVCLPQVTRTLICRRISRMPATSTDHPDSDAAAIEWFSQPLALQLLQQLQRQAIPEITRVFGQSGLYLRPSEKHTEELSGNMLAQVLSLYRQAGALAGSVRCTDTHLPVSSETLSLVYSLCVLETSANPEILFEEMARCLKPEGSLVLLGLNGLSPSSLRWSGKAIQAIKLTQLKKWCSRQGLEISKIHRIGPIWLTQQKKIPRYAIKPGPMNLFYAGYLLVAKKHVAGLTPLRTNKKAYALKPGISPG